MLQLRVLLLARYSLGMGVQLDGLAAREAATSWRVYLFLVIATVLALPLVGIGRYCSW